MSKKYRIKSPDRLKLHSTAALVMLWSLPQWDRGPAQRFVERLDLSAGEDLLRRCDAICPWYGEVILNRKHFVKHLIESLLAEPAGSSQLVILAAGKSPLALELLLEDTSRISRIFEVDLAGLEEKEILYSSLAQTPELKGKLTCSTADITSEDLLDRLVERGFDPDVPTIVLMEGISYYISKDDLERIFTRFRSGGKNAFIVEYLVPCSEVNVARRGIPKGVFSLIRDEAGTDEIRCYSKEELSSLFWRAGGREISCHDMREMELLRLGFNRRFRMRGDGWIECFLGEI